MASSSAERGVDDDESVAGQQQRQQPPLERSPPRSDGGDSNPFRGPAQSTKSVKYRYSATGKHLSSPLKGSPSSPVRSRKRKPSPGLRTSTSLSPLSTPPSSPIQPEPKKTVVPLHTVLSPKHKRPKTTHLDSCPIGTSLWVLVDHLGVLADSTARPDASQERLWWPAQVVQNHPLRVSLFGDFPSSSSSASGLCIILDPLPSNVLSIHDHSGAKRFSPSSFRLPPTTSPLPPDDPLLAKWQSAVLAMDKASTLEQEGLPALLSSYATASGTFHDSPDESESDISVFRPSLTKSTPSARKKARRSDQTPKLKHHPSKRSLTGTVPRHWSPCPPDPTLQIPGELVFALAPRTGGFYWPAQIIEHVPARHERYKIKFLDEKEYTLTRDKFWTSEQEGFVRCTLGEWESAVNCADDPDSEDDESTFGPDDDDENATGPNDATPPLPPPPPPIEFHQLSVRRQLTYVKPVLRAILVNTYHPAREKHDAFFKGGSARASLLKSAGVRGGMDARFVNAVRKAICRWVLGDNAFRADKPHTENLAPPDTLPLPGVLAQADVQTDSHDDTSNGDLLSTDQFPQDAPMVVDGQDQTVPPVNGAASSPQVQQASLTAKSQLDLLAEVSQAVATKPSLLPSHPEIPNLNLNLPPEQSSSQPSPLTPIPEEDPRIPPRKTSPVVCKEIEMLSHVEKLDYCLNILLPESVQQLLLWRSGERTSAALVSPEEEQKMHDTGVRKAAETDWVEDLMKLRAAQARLWGVDLNKKTVNTAEVVGGTRSRPRWGTVSKP